MALTDGLHLLLPFLVSGYDFTAETLGSKQYTPDKDGRRRTLTHNDDDGGLFHWIHNGFSAQLIAESGQSVDGRWMDLHDALPRRQFVSYCEFDLDAARTENIILTIDKKVYGSGVMRLAENKGIMAAYCTKWVRKRLLMCYLFGIALRWNRSKSVADANGYYFK